MKPPKVRFFVLFSPRSSQNSSEQFKGGKYLQMRFLLLAKFIASCSFVAMHHLT